MLRGSPRSVPSPIHERSGRRDDRPSGAGALRTRCLHQLFEVRAKRSPDAIAITCDGCHVSYRDLDHRADRVAGALRAIGVGPEVPVGVFVERSVDLLVAMLGILKAGGTYVPLDPAYPAERVEMILEDARAPVLLTHRNAVTSLPTHSSRILCLDDPEVDLLASEGAAAVEPRASNLAYIIYTSGSTGRPKGVAVTHANAMRLFSATQAWFRFGPDDVWTLFHSFAFDFSVWEIWGALLFGGRLVVVPYWVSRSPSSFLDLLRDERVTVLNQTPSAFRQLIQADQDSDEIVDLSLRYVIFGGEALELQSLRPWFERRGDSSPRLINMYGITETTVHVTYRPVTAADLASHPSSSPIGVPIPDLKLYLLDPNLRPVPIGVVGEIYVGGAGLARGYLNRPDLTADRFVPDPFRRAPGCRMYRSGDLARRRSSGELEYVGRADNQVKIRGFRIELGEIESALSRHPAVAAAVVVARDDRPGDRRLVAYVVSRRGESLSAAELRRWLEPILPAYMMPSAFVELDTLPLTAHGKVDRDSLPAPTAERSSLLAGYEAPRTAEEAAMCEVWSGVLGVERIGVRDSFFDLGGHSLLATQVISRLRETLGVEVPLRALFEAPTVAELVDRMTTARRAATVEPIASTGAAPVASFSQQALWYLDQLAPGQPTFNVTAAVRISGPFDPVAFSRSVDELVKRHEVLRTTFVPVEGRPVPVVAERGAPSLRFIDLTDRPESDRESEATSIAADEAIRPFDLASGPLVRVTLFRLSDRDHAVAISMHHIITDGWSFGVAAAELSELYEAFLEGQPARLAALPLQYGDYARWQRDRLSGDFLDELLGYWTRRLDGLRPLELQTDRPRPALRTGLGKTRVFSLPAGLAESLRALCRRENATPYMALLAAFQVLLHRHSGQEDFAIGSPVANRNHTAFEGLIGYFVNMVAMRADLSGDPSFRELLGRAKETSLGAFAHQELPLDLLVESIQPRRDPARTPLFQAMFVLQNTIMPDAVPDGLTIAPLGTPEGTGTAKFDLSLGMVETSDGYSGSLEYSTDLFDDPTIDRMVGHFIAILERVVAESEVRISGLEILPAWERQLVVEEWNRTDEEFPTDLCVHQLIEARTRRTPDATAISSGPNSLSYRELVVRADRLAHTLQAMGVGPEHRVGLAIDRSIDQAVGLLGILKSGAAYVPLDPAYPPARLEMLMADARICVLLTARHLIGLLPRSTARVLLIDEPSPDLPREWISPAVDPLNAAYVIATSGSTGTPKGVIVSHRSLVNHNVATASLFGLRPDDRVLQFGSISFDLAAEEFFPAWISGASVIMRDDEHLDASRFNRKIADEGITVLDLPTAFWHAWVRELISSGDSLPETLRLVVVGGEEASAWALADWQAIAGDRVRWVNTYGPTEATIIATAFESSGPGTTRVPIGRPIANAKAYVLDGQYRPVPIGLPGELYLGGEGVARGYDGRPRATAERFVPDPFANEPGRRLYRTGDLARWRGDGQLEFLGRIDDQVKIRGHRIEPGEVESVLRSCPGIDDSAVVVRLDAAGEHALAAFVVGAANREAVRSFLRDRLPRHMRPSTLILLDSLPLTPTGKIDRRALIAEWREDRGEPDRTPRDDRERKLVAIFEEVLGVTGVGVADDFFDLGGHSLLAVRVMSRIAIEFDRDLSLADFILAPTVEDLATKLGESVPAGVESPLIPLSNPAQGMPFFCVHPVGGGVMCYADLARCLGPSHAVYGLQASGLSAGSEPVPSISEMAARYLRAIRAERPRGPYHLGGWSLGGVVAFEMARQLAEMNEHVASLVMIDSYAPRPGIVPADEEEIQAAIEREIARDPALRGIGTDYLDRFRNVFRVHCRAMARYRPARLRTRITLIRASQSRGSDNTLGWGTLVPEMTVHVLPGDHDSLLRKPTVGALAELISHALAGERRS